MAVIKKSLPYTISTINPKTDKGDDLIATARAAVTHLHDLCQQDEVGRYIGRFPIQKVLEGAGFREQVPHLVLFLNFMGLVRKLNKCGGGPDKSQYRYLVVDPEFFDFLVTEESVYTVLKQMNERLELQKLCYALGKKLERLETDMASGADVLADMNENLAEVIAECEKLRKEVAEKDTRISELESQLQASTKLDPRTVSEELMARFRGKQDKSS